MRSRPRTVGGTAKRPKTSYLRQELNIGNNFELTKVLGDGSSVMLSPKITAATRGKFTSKKGSMAQPQSPGMVVSSEYMTMMSSTERSEAMMTTRPTMYNYRANNGLVSPIA